MIDTISKRIQSRLTRKGISVSLSEIREQVNILIPDLENITDDDLNNVISYFMSQKSALATTNNPDIIEIENSPVEEEKPSSDFKSVLATTPKSELVSQTANSLNIELSTTEIEAIATNFTTSSDDFTTTLEELKNAILAFIAHKVSTNNQIISNTINEIYQTATDGFESNNAHLNNGLSQLNTALNQQSADFKSRLKNTLAKFQIPAA